MISIILWYVVVIFFYEPLQYALNSEGGTGLSITIILIVICEATMWVRRDIEKSKNKENEE